MNFNINTLDFKFFRGKTHHQILDHISKMEILHSDKIEILKCLNELGIIEFDLKSPNDNILFTSRVINYQIINSAIQPSVEDLMRELSK